MKNKSFIFSLFLSLITAACFGQSGSGSLDGQSYKIDTWDITKSNLKTPDKLVFENGMADAPVCHEYGFFASPYTTYEKDGRMYFQFTSDSQSEGTLAVTGEIVDGAVKGSYVWNKPDQGRLKYQFKGELFQ